MLVKGVKERGYGGMKRTRLVVNVKENHKDTRLEGTKGVLRNRKHGRQSILSSFRMG